VPRYFIFIAVPSFPTRRVGLFYALIIDELKRLVNALPQKKHGAEKVVIETNSALKPAVHIYEKYGFKSVPIEKTDFARERLFCMRLSGNFSAIFFIRAV
jgi:hypothetical protein